MGLLDAFAAALGLDPLHDPRDIVSLAVTEACFEAFARAPPPDALKRRAIAGRLDIHDLQEAARLCNPLWTAFAVDDDFGDEGVFHLAAVATAAAGVIVEAEIVDEDGLTARLSCNGRSTHVRHPGREAACGYDGVAAALNRLLPAQAEIRGLAENRDDLCGYAALPGEDWARLRRDAPALVSRLFRPLSPAA